MRWASRSLRLQVRSISQKESALAWFKKHSDPSFLEELTEDPDAGDNSPNQDPREVTSGHYVRVSPTPLKDPYLIAFSSEMGRELGLTPEMLRDPSIIAWLSGEHSTLLGQTWATPYALSIYGRPSGGCPFGTGNGYGDGRAISIVEVMSVNGELRELQLKGAGRTPWCRGGDGRAVLRSSVREFLTSEAMHHLGVSTTRALSLCTSKSERVDRMWYSESLPPGVGCVPYGGGFGGGDEPDCVVKEQCAITCRVSPSFIRVGSMELYARRAVGAFPGSTELARQELEELLRFALKREYQGVVEEDASFQECALALLENFSDRLSQLSAEWLRVGYCQGNFNSDNCLLGGRTMDYGPFGFIERFEPFWNMWTGGGKHYGFMNQPQAAMMNFAALAQHLLPLLDESGQSRVQEMVTEFANKARLAVNEVFRRKLGLTMWSEEAHGVRSELFKTLETVGLDYTIFFRELTNLVRYGKENPDSVSTASLLEPLTPAFYRTRRDDSDEALATVIRSWLRLVGDRTEEEAVQEMLMANPKYIPREWMLVQAYQEAQKGKVEVIKELQTLFLNPYEEQLDLEEKYYRRRPDDLSHMGGIAYMT